MEQLKRGTCTGSTSESEAPEEQQAESASQGESADMEEQAPVLTPTKAEVKTEAPGRRTGTPPVRAMSVRSRGRLFTSNSSLSGSKRFARSSRSPEKPEPEAWSKEEKEMYDFLFGDDDGTSQRQGYRGLILRRKTCL